MGTMRGEAENRDPAAGLEALWEATRPVQPSAQDWDRVWASVSADLERLPSPTVSARSEGAIAYRPSSRLGRRPLAVAAAAVTIMLAQAAAILLAFGLSWPTTEGGAETPAPSQVATSTVRIEEGKLVLIRSNAGAVQAIDLTAHLGVGGVDAWYLAYNLLESMMKPVVVMSE